MTSNVLLVAGYGIFSRTAIQIPIEEIELVSDDFSFVLGNEDCEMIECDLNDCVFTALCVLSVLLRFTLFLRILTNEI